MHTESIHFKNPVRLLQTLAAAAALILLFVTVVQGTSHAAPPETDHTISVGVLPFDVESAASSAYIGPSLEDILSSRLAEKGAVSVIDPLRIRKALGTKGLPARGEIRALMDALGADYLVKGSVRLAGPKVHIDMELQGPAGEMLPTSFSVPSDNPSGLLEKSEEYVARIKGFLAHTETPGAVSHAPAEATAPAAPTAAGPSTTAHPELLAEPPAAPDSRGAITAEKKAEDSFDTEMIPDYPPEPGYGSERSETPRKGWFSKLLPWNWSRKAAPVPSQPTEPPAYVLPREPETTAVAEQARTARPPEAEKPAKTEKKPPAPAEGPRWQWY